MVLRGYSGFLTGVTLVVVGESCTAGDRILVLLHAKYALQPDFELYLALPGAISDAAEKPYVMPEIQSRVVATAAVYLTIYTIFPVS